MAKKKEPIVYKDLTLDSIGELEFCYWLEEATNKGLVETWSRGETYLLSKPIYNEYKIALKTKPKAVKKTILQEHVYTYDFLVVFTDLGQKFLCNQFGEEINKFFICDNFGQSYSENKPKFDFNNMTRLVKLNIKWVLDKYDIYVQIVENESLFKETWTPAKLLTTKTGKIRKINWKVRSIEEFLKDKI